MRNKVKLDILSYGEDSAEIKLTIRVYPKVSKIRSSVLYEPSLLLRAITDFLDGQEE